MRRKLVLMAIILSFAAAPIWAQDARFEIGAFGGWTFSDGVSGDPVPAGDGNIYNRVDPTDSYSYGLSIGFFPRSGVEVGFQWSRQESKLEVSGTTTREVGDMNVDNYHGYVAYGPRFPTGPARPYVLLGLGATHFGGVRFTFNGEPREVGGETRFSPTLGVGVKFYTGNRLGLRLGARWTPTYVKTDAVGWWCDPFWGCYTVGNAQYANQFDLSGGLVVRF